jgi:hypothetical protein
MCREVLKECPLAVEAIRCLLQLGVKLKEIQVGYRYRAYQTESINVNFLIWAVLLKLC